MRKLDCNCFIAKNITIFFRSFKDRFICCFSYLVYDFCYYLKQKPEPKEENNQVDQKVYIRKTEQTVVKFGYLIIILNNGFSYRYLFFCTKSYYTQKSFYIFAKKKNMFSGIVEEAGKVVSVERDQENVHLTLTCSFVDELKIDQSLSHNGVVSP